MRRRKTTIIITMCVAILLMATGYALLSTKLNINGSTAVTSSWRVEFSDIRTTKQMGGATNVTAPTASGTMASFNVDLVQPGDEITYELDIMNYGDIEAEIKGATYTITGSEAIYVTVSGIRKGTRIGSCEGLSTCPKVTATIKVGYNPGVTSDPATKRKNINIILDVGQYVAGSPVEDGELIPQLKVNLAQKILSDNTSQIDTGIDFSKPASATNGIGLYYTSTNTEGNKKTYYFRGDVKNNYVYFAGYYWRIVRINEDGSIRMIYQGQTPNATGEDTSIAKLEPSLSAAFNNSTDDDAYVGYMYGSTVKANSTVKALIDTWYAKSLDQYSSYLADAGFCNDRSSGTGSGTITYSGSTRYLNNHTPQFVCPQTNDLFTTASSTKGNKALTYPVGLLTTDEAMYAGVVWGQIDNYLLVDKPFWTMTPASGAPTTSVFSISSMTYGTSVNNTNQGVRPVINLKSDVNIIPGGAGTATNPYVVS